MSRIRFDQLFKQYLEEFLTPLGRVQRNREIPGEPAFIDLWFEPTPAPEIQPNQLGLLGRLTHTASVIEPYHPPQPGRTSQLPVQAAPHPGRNPVTGPPG